MKDIIRKRILRVHGSLLILVGSALATASSQGFGMFSFLNEMPFAIVGLFQAYLLIAVIGGTLWLGSYTGPLRRWHLIGAIAHIPPLAANILFMDQFEALGMATLSYKAMVFHSIFILLEGASYLVNRADQKVY